MKFLGLLLVLQTIFSACSTNVKPERIPLERFTSTYENVISLSRSLPDSSLKIALKGLQFAQDNSDTAQAYMHIAVGIGYKEAGRLDSALIHYSSAEEIASTLEDPILLSSVYNNRGLAQKGLGNLYRAKRQFYKSLNLRETLSDSVGIVRCHQNIADVQKGLGILDSAVYNALQALLILRTTGRVQELGGAWISLGNIYLSLERRTDALQAYRNAQRTIKDQSELKQLAIAYFNLGGYWINASQVQGYLDSAETNYRAALSKFDLAGSAAYRGHLTDAFGSIYQSKGQHKKACRLFRRARKIYSAQGDIEGIVITCLHLSEALNSLGHRDSAAVNLHRSKKLCLKTNDNQYLLLTYDLLSEQLPSQTNTDSAIHYIRKSHHLEDSLKNENVLFRVGRSKEHFEKLIAEQENQVKHLELEKQKTKNEYLIVFILALFIISIMTVILFQQRLKTKNQLAQKNEELHLQKLDELAKQKELEKITMLMEGQEQERKRIAGELHDGLGTLLATVKHHFEVVEDKMDTSRDEYVKAYGLLDEASEEVRRISHNMASNVLSKFGLVAALQDLCEMVNASEKLKINLKVSGLEARLENSKEIHLFRICQELVSNALKHARARTVTLQLTMHTEALNLIVEDDGIGFAPDPSEKDEGMGLENLKARVAHLDGSIDIDSVMDRGTTVVIDVPI